MAIVRGNDVTTFSAEVYIGPAPGVFNNHEVHISEVHGDHLRSNCYAWSDTDPFTVKARATRLRLGHTHLADTEPDFDDPGGYSAHLNRSERTTVRVSASDDNLSNVAAGCGYYRRLCRDVSRRVDFYQVD